MMLLEPMDLMTYMLSMKMIRQFRRKTINAQELFLNILKERAETGRLYIMNIDHCNSHSSFKDKVR
jgi:ribonucleoside-diphosphate reductase alpha chain